MKKDYMHYCKRTIRIKPWLTVLSILLNIGIFCYTAVNASCVRNILNSLQNNVKGTGILKIIMPYVIMMILIAAVRYACIIGSSYVDAYREYYYRNSTIINMFKGIFKSDNLKNTAANSGKAFECIDDDIPNLIFPVELITEVLGYIVLTATAMGTLLIINWKITVFIFIPLSVGLFIINIMSDKISEHREANRDTHDTVTCNLSDFIYSIMSIKTLNAKKNVLKHYNAINEKRRKAVLRDTLFQSTVSSVVEISSKICVAIIMGIVAKLMLAGKFPIGDFAIFIYYMDTLCDCILRVLELYTEYKKSEVSYQRIIDVIDDKNTDVFDNTVRLRISEKAASNDKKEKLKINDDIEKLEPLKQLQVKNLTCLYDDGRGVRNVSFDVNSGEIIVLTGPVASGKSSIVNAMTGIVPKSSGQIIWNKKEIKDLYNSLKNPNVSVYLQSGKLLNATIRENITLGKAYSDEECWSALKQSCLYDEVFKMTDKLESLIGENGVNLSGGQKQRLLLARIMISEASLFILDDATSALNSETEDLVLKNINKRIRNRNTAAIIISDKSKALQLADRIIRI